MRIEKLTSMQWPCVLVRKNGHCVHSPAYYTREDPDVVYLSDLNFLSLKDPEKISALLGRVIWFNVEILYDKDSHDLSLSVAPSSTVADLSAVELAPTFAPLRAPLPPETNNLADLITQKLKGFKLTNFLIQFLSRNMDKIAPLFSLSEPFEVKGQLESLQRMPPDAFSFFKSFIPEAVVSILNALPKQCLIQIYTLAFSEQFHLNTRSNVAKFEKWVEEILKIPSLSIASELLAKCICHHLDNNVCINLLPLIKVMTQLQAQLSPTDYNALYARFALILGLQHHMTRDLPLQHRGAKLIRDAISVFPFKAGHKEIILSDQLPIANAFHTANSDRVGDSLWSLWTQFTTPNAVPGPLSLVLDKIRCYLRVDRDFIEMNSNIRSSKTWTPREQVSWKPLEPVADDIITVLTTEGHEELLDFLSLILDEHVKKETKSKLVKIIRRKLELVEDVNALQPRAIALLQKFMDLDDLFEAISPILRRATGKIATLISPIEMIDEDVDEAHLTLVTIFRKQLKSVIERSNANQVKDDLQKSYEDPSHPYYEYHQIIGDFFEYLTNLKAGLDAPDVDSNLKLPNIWGDFFSKINFVELPPSVFQHIVEGMSEHFQLYDNMYYIPYHLRSDMLFFISSCFYNTDITYTYEHLLPVIQRHFTQDFAKYRFCLMSPDVVNLEERTIYLSNENGKIAYDVITPDGKRVHARIVRSNAPVPFTLESLAPFEEAILNITTKAKHTNSAANHLEGIFTPEGSIPFYYYKFYEESLDPKRTLILPLFKIPTSALGSLSGIKFHLTECKDDEEVDDAAWCPYIFDSVSQQNLDALKKLAEHNEAFRNYLGDYLRAFSDYSDDLWDPRWPIYVSENTSRLEFARNALQILNNNDNPELILELIQNTSLEVIQNKSTLFDYLSYFAPMSLRIKVYQLLLNTDIPDKFEKVKILWEKWFQMPLEGGTNMPGVIHGDCLKQLVENPCYDNLHKFLQGFGKTTTDAPYRILPFFPVSWLLILRKTLFAEGLPALYKKALFEEGLVESTEESEEKLGAFQDVLNLKARESEDALMKWSQAGSKQELINDIVNNYYNLARKASLPSQTSAAAAECAQPRGIVRQFFQPPNLPHNTRRLPAAPVTVSVETAVPPVGSFFVPHTDPDASFLEELRRLDSDINPFDPDPFI